MRTGFELVRPRRQRAVVARDTSISNRREAELLQLIAASTSRTEQAGYAAELAGLRAEREGVTSQQQDVAMAAQAMARFSTSANAQSTRHTVASDWLLDVEEPSGAGDQVAQQMASLAAQWWRRLPDEVKRYPSELRTQAAGIAQREASAYGPLRGHAAGAFLRQVDAMYSGTAGELLFQAYPQPDPGSSLPVGVTNEDTAYDDGSWAPDSNVGSSPRPSTDGSETPSLDEGPAPAGDVSQGVDNPAAEETHDAGPGPGSVDSVDYLDGTRTPSSGTGSGTMELNSRRLAPVSRIQSVNMILRARRDGVVDGYLVDPPTAAALRVLHDMLDRPGRSRFEREPVPSLVSTAYQHASRAAMRAVADGGSTDLTPGATVTDSPMPSDRGSETPSMNEGSGVAADVSQSAVDPAAATSTHDESAGNGATADFLDGQQYPWVTSSSMRTSAGSMPPWLKGDDDDDDDSGDDSDGEGDNDSDSDDDDPGGADFGGSDSPDSDDDDDSNDDPDDDDDDDSGKKESLRLTYAQQRRQAIRAQGSVAPRRASDMVTCPQCGGTGSTPAAGAQPDVNGNQPCSLCGGSGQVSADLAAQYTMTQAPTGAGATSPVPPAGPTTARLRAFQDQVRRSMAASGRGAA